MIECPVNHPALPALFDPHVPNNAALWAVFHGRHAGRAVVDDLQQPSQCVLHTDAVMTYASQQVTEGFLDEAINFYKQVVPIWLIRPQDAPLAPDGYRKLSRLEFYDYDPQSTILADFRSRLPAGYEIRTIDFALLERCLWRDDMEIFCGSLENFMRNALGICLMHGDEIIVEAYTSALGDRYAEIGAITHEPYRGQGFAPITAAYLIEALEQRGFHSYWSCDVNNPASARVARKLGFLIEKSYEIWEYEPEKS
jgi:RimJ/RimL family protein N-acetyltransferase